MQYNFTEKQEMKCNDVEYGDLLIFYKSNGEPTESIYMICYDESIDNYFLQNLNGFKKKPVYYKTINELLISRKNYRIVKKDNAGLSICLDDARVCVFSPF